MGKLASDEMYMCIIVSSQSTQSSHGAYTFVDKHDTTFFTPSQKSQQIATKKKCREPTSSVAGGKNVLVAVKERNRNISVVNFKRKLPGLTLRHYQEENQAYLPVIRNIKQQKIALESKTKTHTFLWKIPPSFAAR